ncbi:MAG: cob(I)yrinic acid a,c-diamide adenosyltransferase [Desulfobacterales bacterium]|jgi:cob(I)alamin adenosyltransferase
MRGFVQVYTGNGKGKTTAAMGLVLRAAGAGLSAFVAQFAKDGTSSEILGLKRFSDRVSVEAYGTGRFIGQTPAPEEIAAAQRGLDRVRRVLGTGRHDLVVIDEGCTAVRFGLFTVEELMAVIDRKPETTELVVTGRGAPPELIARADLVTEMREIKHYYHQGVGARRGIEQ